MLYLNPAARDGRSPQRRAAGRLYDTVGTAHPLDERHLPLARSTRAAALCQPWCAPAISLGLPPNADLNQTKIRAALFGSLRSITALAACFRSSGVLQAPGNAPGHAASVCARLYDHNQDRTGRRAGLDARSGTTDAYRLRPHSCHFPGTDALRSCLFAPRQRPLRRAPLFICRPLGSSSLFRSLKVELNLSFAGGKAAGALLPFVQRARDASHL